MKNRKNTAIPAAKKDFWSSSFVCADTSLTATGAAAAAARAASAWICAGDSGVVPAATVATDSRIRFRSAAKLSVIDRATSVEMGASTLPMTCIEAGWPAWTRAEKPAGMTMTAASVPFAGQRPGLGHGGLGVDGDQPAPADGRQDLAGELLADGAVVGVDHPEADDARRRRPR